ncbi:uncharacterized protein LOC119740130 [Patiria miniata]|uniref:Uncharacterized protein n=1 Tax=Patiria miniata TaxID=46514 RepID=A0A914B5A7_PATMI|nr:uncharacterized protein LOC119740130 [Patiria miniata]
MGGRSVSLIGVVIVVVTILVAFTWAETANGSLSQKVKIRREGRESDKYWSKDVGLTDQQLRQLLANSLTNSYSTGEGESQTRPAKPGYRLYGNRLSDTNLGIDGNEEDEVETEVTPRGSALRTSKRNGFFYGKRNGFFYGKRSGSTLENANQCTQCGPQNSGQCVMFGTCCSYAAGGCFFMTEEALPCVTSKTSSICQLQGAPCGSDGYGRCVADSVCCSPQEGACHVDVACSSKPTYQ